MRSPRWPKRWSHVPTSGGSSPPHGCERPPLPAPRLPSPSPPRAAPPLAAVTAPIVAAGGFVTTIGAAPPDCGVFERSRERERLYREGRFTPTTGLVIWPRADMLRWWQSYKV